MKMSDNVADLFKALSKFQGELENATKNAVNPGVKNKYADLAECINTAKPHLASNGLAVTQLIGSNESGKQTLITMLTHESGQYISSEFTMADAVLMGGAGKNPVQALGSGITYQRRYAYTAIIGMTQQDDDGNSVQNKPTVKHTPTVQMAAPKQQADIQAKAEELGFTAEQVCQSFNIKSLAQVPASEVQNVLNTIQSWSNK